MLHCVIFSKQRRCNYIDQRTGKYRLSVLNELSEKWIRSLEIIINEVKQSFVLQRKTTRTKYLFDMQFNMLEGCHLP